MYEYGILKLFAEHTNLDTLKPIVQAKINKGFCRIPLFLKLKSLNNRSLYQHLCKYGKFKRWTLVDFVEADAINPKSRDEHHRTLMQVLVAAEKIALIKALLPIMPVENSDFTEAPDSVLDLLSYRPGRGQPSIREYALRREPMRDRQRLEAMILDFEDSTSNESSSVTSSDNEELSSSDESLYAARQRRYIAANTHSKIRLIAARGVHFLDHFSAESRAAIKRDRARGRNVYSQSTLYDAGYDGDNEPDRITPRIKNRHTKIIEFVDKLKESRDKKEKSSRGARPATSRNAQTFDNLFWRFIQAYINSYSFMFTQASIQTNFGYDTSRNPLVSLSYDISKAMMYGSGLRFSIDGAVRRRDPHYRRSTGKPKHPNLGYVDIFSFTVDYVRNHGVDRLLAYNTGKIKLSNLYLSEAELIMVSMIPRQYHLKRRMITAPSFAGDFNPDQRAQTGILTESVFQRQKQALLQVGKGRNANSEYSIWLTHSLTKAVENQAAALMHNCKATLFRRNLVHAYDHGVTLDTRLPTPTR